MTLAVAVGATGAVLATSGCGDGDDPSGPDMKRVAWARYYLNGYPSLKDESPKSIGDALAGLEPTWVTGLVRFEAGQSAKEKTIDGYDAIRAAVRAKAPDSEFDVELNALEFTRPDEVTSQMDELREDFGNDGWFFDFFTPAYKLRPEVVDAAIENAHDHGEWIGGNTFGWHGDPSDPVVPEGADYLALADADFSLNLDDVKTMAQTIPILFHLRNNPDYPASEGCIYMKRWSTSKREAYVKKRASQQSEYDFAFAFPVFFPTCRAYPHAPQFDVVAFDAIRDAGMLTTIRDAMNEYD